MQFALALLLLFATGCRPAELVDAKRKRKTPGSAPDPDDDSGGDGSELEMEDVKSHSIETHESPDATEDEQPERVDALCYEDVRLLVVQNPDRGERDVLAMEVVLSHHKGYKRRPKP